MKTIDTEPKHEADRGSRRKEATTRYHLLNDRVLCRPSREQNIRATRGDRLTALICFTRMFSASLIGLPNT